MKITFDPKIQIKLDKLSVLVKGPYRLVRVFLGFRYDSHGIDQNGEPFLNLHPQHISPQHIKQLKYLNVGLIAGYRKRLYQRGVWTIMKKFRNRLLSFKLGFSHPSIFKIPQHLAFRSRREGQFRTINLYSISYQLVADTAARLLRMRKADIYRLNGFRYALPPIYGPRATSIRLKSGKKK